MMTNKELLKSFQKYDKSDYLNWYWSRIASNLFRYWDAESGEVIFIMTDLSGNPTRIFREVNI